VVVQHLEAVQHAPAAQIVHEVNDLGRAQAELTAVAAGLVPMPPAPGGQLGPHPDARLHAELGRALQDQLQLAGHLDDHDGLQSHLQA
jgi:hypothetical protein